jgi:hypothetical protein
LPGKLKRRFRLVFKITLSDSILPPSCSGAMKAGLPEIVLDRYDSPLIFLAHPKSGWGVWMYVSTYICVRIHTYIHDFSMSVYDHMIKTYLYAHVCMYVYIYIYIYIHLVRCTRTCT